MTTSADTNRIPTKENLLTDYLKRISKIPLLTREEEILLGRKVEANTHLLEKKKELSLDLGREPTLKEWASKIGTDPENLQDILEQGKVAKEKMVRANLRLVVAVAKKYQGYMELLDLIQEGSIGLEKGINKYDTTKGFRLSTYIYQWIRQAIVKAVTQKSRTIRLPGHIVEKINKIKKALRELGQEFNRPISILEVRDQLEKMGENLSEKEITEYLTLNRKTLPLEMETKPEQSVNILDIQKDNYNNNNNTPEQHIMQQAMIQDLLKALSHLTKREKEVLCHYYGIAGYDKLPASKISKKLEIKRTKVELTLTRAKRKIQMYCPDLIEYLL